MSDTCITPYSTLSVAPTSAEPSAQTYRLTDDTVPRRERTLSAKAKLILSLQLRGFKQREIAEMINLKEQQVWRITASRRYLKAFDEKLDGVDNEILRLKPKALRALENGLDSRDEGVGLRASEQWFRAHGYGGFSRHADTNVTVNVTAEDVALQLFTGAAERKALAQNDTPPSTQGQGNSPR